MVFKQSRNEKTVISVRLDTSLLERIDKMATQKELSRNSICVKCRRKNVFRKISATQWKYSGMVIL